MTLEIPRPPLKGKKALLVGIANDHSIAYGCAKAFHDLATPYARRLSGATVYVDGGVNIMA